jgi:hypothetical protein
MVMGAELRATPRHRGLGTGTWGRIRTLGAMLSALVLALGVVALPAAPARADNSWPGWTGEFYEVQVDVAGDAWYAAKFCLKSTTSMRMYPAGSERDCTDAFQLSIWNPVSKRTPIEVGDRIYLDMEVQAGPTKDNIDITGAHSCWGKGGVQDVQLHCPNKSESTTEPVEPTIDAYASGGVPQNVSNILNLMAWCVTAAAVLGVLVTGMNMAVQLNRGVPGEGAEHWRGGVTVLVACLVGATAGPLVQFLDITGTK